MRGLFEEILEIPVKAEQCYQLNRNIKLPVGVPYIGMGSSYYAPLTLYYSRANIHPQIASEYFYYLAEKKEQLAVLVSQSGESSETVWNLKKFKEVVVVVNDKGSTLATSKNTKKVIDIVAGKENYSSTKTYINTLIALYCGLGIDPGLAIEELTKKFETYRKMAKENSEKIFEYLKKNKINGVYVIGSGPNTGTAYEAALTLGETTKLSWIGMPVAQYDHGPKETANNTVVIILNSNGRDKNRINLVKKTLGANSNALVIEIFENSLTEILSPITLMVQVNLLMNYLADLMQVGETFILGEKVTIVDDKV